MRSANNRLTIRVTPRVPWAEKRSRRQPKIKWVGKLGNLQARVGISKRKTGIIEGHWDPAVDIKGSVLLVRTMILRGTVVLKRF